MLTVLENAWLWAFAVVAKTKWAQSLQAEIHETQNDWL